MLENFAFDLLLGKPCLIVSHHEFFKDDCARLIELIEKLQVSKLLSTLAPIGGGYPKGLPPPRQRDGRGRGGDVRQ